MLEEFQIRVAYLVKIEIVKTFMLIRLIEIIISLGFWAIDYLRIFILKKFGKKLKGRCVVLCYHGVTQEQRSSFGRQMDDVIRWTKPISLEKGGELKQGVHYVGITFDDGLTCVIKNALPELDKRKIPTTLFIPTGCLGQRAKWIKEGDYGGRNEIVLSTEQLRDLRENRLVSLGSHCVTHSNLLSLNEKEAEDEIIISKYDLENILEREVDMLSFPHGGFNQPVLESARRVGYKCVFTILPDISFFDRKDFVIGRIRTDPTDWRIEFRLKLLGAYRWLPWAYSLKRKILSVWNWV